MDTVYNEPFKESNGSDISEELNDFKLLHGLL